MTDTFTDTFNREDISRVHASFAADFRIAAEWTGLRTQADVDLRIEQIKALVREQYLKEIHMQLLSSNGAVREAAVYRVSTSASGWSSDRPGDVYWQHFDGDSLYLVVYYSQKWFDLSDSDRQAFKQLHMAGWGESDFDGNYGGLASTVDRHYASRAYGLERTRYSS